jgi:hypothetical protein
MKKKKVKLTRIKLPNGKYHLECDNPACQICNKAFREAVEKAIKLGVKI